MRENDWTLFINKRAAIKEQFPKLRDVLRERPGCTEDRDRRAFYAAENRLSMLRGQVTRTEQERRVAADAEVFIARMKAADREMFLARFANRRAS